MSQIPQTSRVPLTRLRQREPSLSSMISLFLGVAMCLPMVGGVGAIAAGIYALRQPISPLVSGRRMAVIGIVLGCINLAVWPTWKFAIAPRMIDSMKLAGRASRDRLETIAQSISIYLAKNAGYLPPDLATALKAHNRDTELARMPADNTLGPPYRYRVEAIAQPVRANEHGAHDTVIVYEPPASTARPWVLYLDGRLEQMDAAELSRLTTTPATTRAVP